MDFIALLFHRFDCLQQMSADYGHFRILHNTSIQYKYNINLTFVL